MESSDLAAQISPSTISPAPGTSPNSYISTVKICENYENYLAPYLKPVYQAIPRTFPLVGTPPKNRQVMCHFRTLGYTFKKKKTKLGATTWLITCAAGVLMMLPLFGHGSMESTIRVPFLRMLAWGDFSLHPGGKPGTTGWFFVTRFGVKPLNCPFKSVWNP